VSEAIFDFIFNKCTQTQKTVWGEYEHVYVYVYVCACMCVCVCVCGVRVRVCMCLVRFRTSPWSPRELLSEHHQS
jgi:hypothetical protein